MWHGRPGHVLSFSFIERDLATSEMDTYSYAPIFQLLENYILGVAKPFRL